MQASDEPQDRVTINSAVLNDYRLGLAFPSLLVAPGQEIVGTVDLTVVNDQDDPLAPFPAGATPTWGDHETSFCQIASQVPLGTRRYDVAVDMTAPTEPGTYAIILAASAEASLAHVMSATDSASGPPLWNNGDDIAEWDSGQALFATTNGYLNAPYHPSSPNLVGAGAIRIVVSDRAPVQRLRAPSIDGCAATDRAALVALYNATDGDNWTDNTNWLSSEPIGEWYGVTTNSDGHVTSLKLAENNLSGKLPAELGDLSELQCLSLWGNSLTGSIPEELGDLANLTQLDLLGNGLDGSIPSSLGDLTGLERLHLAENDLSGSIPSSLGDLANLESLYLFRNDLDGSIPSSLGDLANLTWLYISENGFTGCVPAGLRNVPNHDLGNLSSLSYCSQTSSSGVVTQDSSTSPQQSSDDEAEDISIGPRQSSDYGADAEDISVSLSTIYAGQRASISAQFQNQSSSTGPDGGAATFDLRIYVELPSGTEATVKEWDNQEFTLNQERTFSQSYTFASAGTYTVYAEVYDNMGQQSVWNSTNRFDQLSETFTVRDQVTVQISPTSYTVDEDDGSVTITLTASESLSSPAEVRLETSDGTARHSLDYTRVATNVSFPANTTSHTVSLAIRNDLTLEATRETFSASLASITGSALAANTSPATVTIVDEDEVTLGFMLTRYTIVEGRDITICIQVNSPTVSYPHDGGFTVHLSYDDLHGAGLSGETAYEFDNRGGTRRLCRDYEIPDDNVVERTHTVDFKLDSVTSDSPGVASRVKFDSRSSNSTVEVLDNDGAFVEFEQASYRVTEGDAVEVCAVLARGATVEFPFTVNISYTDPDGVVSSGPASLTFGYLASRSCGEFQTRDDNVAGGSSQVSLSLARPTDLDRRFSLGPAATLTVLDDEALVNRAPTVGRSSPANPGLSIPTGLSQTFTARATDPDSNISRWKWSIDGVSQGGQSVALTGDITREFSHRFVSPGSYTVMVTFTDAGGLSDSASWDVQVKGPDLTTCAAPTGSSQRGCDGSPEVCLPAKH